MYQLDRDTAFSALREKKSSLKDKLFRILLSYSSFLHFFLKTQIINLGNGNDNGNGLMVMDEKDEWLNY